MKFKFCVVILLIVIVFTELNTSLNENKLKRVNLSSNDKNNEIEKLMLAKNGPILPKFQKTNQIVNLNKNLQFRFKSHEDDETTNLNVLNSEILTSKP